MINQITFHIMSGLLFFMFFLGVYGIGSGRAKSYLIIFGSIEIMLLAINLQFLLLSTLLDNVIGQIFSIFILLIAASEIAIGLSILIVF